MSKNINTLIDREYRNLESRLRRNLGKQGYALKKRKNIYGVPGYMIVDTESKYCVDGHIPTEFCLDLSEVAKFAK